MWKSLLGGGEKGSGKGDRRGDDDDAPRTGTRSQSTTTSSSKRKSSRRDEPERDGAYAPSSRSPYVGAAAPSVASSYTTAYTQAATNTPTRDPERRQNGRMADDVPRSERRSDRRDSRRESKRNSGDGMGRARGIDDDEDRNGTEKPPKREESSQAEGEANPSLVQNQFPGEFPTTYTAPYRPPGLAAEYYGDHGESVAFQPGVRPQPPAIIESAEYAHLHEATVEAKPPPEPSSLGHTGAAASFFANPADYDDEPEIPPTTPSRPARRSTLEQSRSPGVIGRERSPRGPTDPRPMMPTNTGRTAAMMGPGAMAAGAGAGVGAAAEYFTGNIPITRVNEQQSSVTNSNYQSFATTSQTASTTRPPRPSASQTTSSNLPVYGAAAAAGLAGVAALGAYEASQSHGQANGQYSMSQTQQGEPGFVQGQNESGYSTMQQQQHRHRHRGPMTKFVDWFRDPEGVAEFEVYTEAIGVCKYCFDPNSSPRDAPRPHHYRSRRYSGGRYDSSTRVDKLNRYSSDEERRRRSSRKTEKLVATGLAAAGATKIGESIYKQKHDFDDTYSVQSGRPMTAPRVSVRDDEDRYSDSRRKRRSRDERRSSRGDGESVYVQQSSRRRNSSASDERFSGSKGAAMSAALGAGAAAVAIGEGRRERKRSRSPKKKYYSKRVSPRHSYVDLAETTAGPVGFGDFFSSPSANRRRGKKNKGFFSFSNASSSSSDADLVYGQGTVRRKSSRRGRDEGSGGANATAAILGLAATGAALAAESDRRESKGKQRERADERVGPDRRDPRRVDRKSKYDDPTSLNGDEDVWEDATDDEASSVDTALAYGGRLSARTSRESLAEEGTAKWGWRWNSRRDSDRTSQCRRSPKPDVSKFDTVSPELIAAGVGAAAGAAALTGASQFVPSPARLDSVNQPPMRVLDPVPTVDSPADSRRVSGPNVSPRTSVQPSVMATPTSVPLQQPQPYTPVSRDVYNPRPQFSETPSGPTVFDKYPARPDARRTDLAEQQVRSSIAEAEPTAGIRRSETSPAALPSARQSVNFELTQEQRDREQRALEREQRRAARRERREREARETGTVDPEPSSERRREKRRSKDAESGTGADATGRNQDVEASVQGRRGSGDARAAREAEIERELQRLYEEDRRLTEERKRKAKSVGAAVVGAAIGAGAVASVLERTSRSEDERDMRDERDERDEAGQRPKRKSSLKRSADPDAANAPQDTQEERIARMAAQRVTATASPVHEDYSTFFVPDELAGEVQKHNAAAEHRDDEAEVVEIVPRSMSKSKRETFDPFLYRPFGTEPDDDPLRFPWAVPRLGLVAPTPPASRTPSLHGDVTPRVASPEPEPKSRSSSRGSKVTWGDHDTYVYEVVTPEYEKHEFTTTPSSLSKVYVTDDENDASPTTPPKIPPVEEMTPEQQEHVSKGKSFADLPLSEGKEESSRSVHEQISPVVEEREPSQLPGTNAAHQLELAAAVAATAAAAATALDGKTVTDGPASVDAKPAPGAHEDQEPKTVYQSPFAESVSDLGMFGDASTVPLPPAPKAEADDLTVDSDRVASERGSRSEERRQEREPPLAAVNAIPLPSNQEPVVEEVTPPVPGSFSVFNYLVDADGRSLPSASVLGATASSVHGAETASGVMPHDTAPSVEASMARDMPQPPASDDEFDKPRRATTFDEAQLDQQRPATPSRTDYTSDPEDWERSSKKSMSKSKSSKRGLSDIVAIAGTTAVGVAIGDDFYENVKKSSRKKSRKNRDTVEDDDGVLSSRRSQRDSAVFDDEPKSVVSSTTAASDDKDGRRKKDKKSTGGFFSLFSSTKSDVSSSDKPKSQSDEVEKRRSRSQPDRERNDSPRKSRRKSRDRDVGDGGSEPGRSTDDWQAVTSDTTREVSVDDGFVSAEEAVVVRIRKQDETSEAPFLGERPDVPTDTDGASGLPDQKHHQEEPAQQNDAEIVSSVSRSVPDPMQVQDVPTLVDRDRSVSPHTMTAELPPPSPVVDERTQKRLSAIRTSGFASRPLAGSSPTAVPLVFRRMPVSPHTARSGSVGSPFTTTDLPFSPLATPRTRQPRPKSTEFRSSTEFRPLYLVERHSSTRPATDELEGNYPSLPSSRTSSAHASMEDLRAAHDDDGGFSLNTFTPEQIRARRHSYSAWHDRPRSPDFLDSRTATPTATDFPRDWPKERPKYEFHSPSELEQDPHPNELFAAYADLPQSTLPVEARDLGESAQHVDPRHDAVPADQVMSPSKDSHHQESVLPAAVPLPDSPVVAPEVSHPVHVRGEGVHDQDLVLPVAVPRPDSPVAAPETRHSLHDSAEATHDREIVPLAAVPLPGSPVTVPEIQHRVHDRAEDAHHEMVLPAAVPLPDSPVPVPESLHRVHDLEDGTTDQQTVLLSAEPVSDRSVAEPEVQPSMHGLEESVNAYSNLPLLGAAVLGGLTAMTDRQRHSHNLDSQEHVLPPTDTLRDTPVAVPERQRAVHDPAKHANDEDQELATREIVAEPLAQQVAREPTEKPSAEARAEELTVKSAAQDVIGEPVTEVISPASEAKEEPAAKETIVEPRAVAGVEMPIEVAQERGVKDIAEEPIAEVILPEHSAKEELASTDIAEEPPAANVVEEPIGRVASKLEVKNVVEEPRTHAVIDEPAAEEPTDLIKAPAARDLTVESEMPPDDPIVDMVPVPDHEKQRDPVEGPGQAEQEPHTARIIDRVVPAAFAPDTRAVDDHMVESTASHEPIEPLLDTDSAIQPTLVHSRSLEDLQRHEQAIRDAIEPRPAAIMDQPEDDEWAMPTKKGKKDKKEKKGGKDKKKKKQSVALDEPAATSVDDRFDPAAATIPLPLDDEDVDPIVDQAPISLKTVPTMPPEPATVEVAGGEQTLMNPATLPVPPPDEATPEASNTEQTRDIEPAAAVEDSWAGVSSKKSKKGKKKKRQSTVDELAVIDQYTSGTSTPAEKTADRDRDILATTPAPVEHVAIASMPEPLPIAEEPLVEEPLAHDVTEQPRGHEPPVKSVAEEIPQKPHAPGAVQPPTVDELAEEPVAKEVITEPTADVTHEVGAKEVHQEPPSQETVPEPNHNDVPEKSVAKKVLEGLTTFVGLKLGAKEPTEKPASEEVVHEPGAKEVVEQPVLEGPAERPVTQPLTKESVAKDFASEPSAQELAEEPEAKQATHEPAAEIASQSRAESAGKEAADPVAQKPGAEEVTDKPAAEHVAEVPIAHYVIEEPAAKEATEKPIAQEVEAKPAADISRELGTRDIVPDAVTENVAEESAAATVVEGPVVERTIEEAAARDVVQKPVEGAADVVGATESAEESAAANRVGQPVSEENTEESATKEATEAPAAALVQDAGAKSSLEESASQEAVPDAMQDEWGFSTKKRKKYQKKPTLEAAPVTKPVRPEEPTVLAIEPEGSESRELTLEPDQIPSIQDDAQHDLGQPLAIPAVANITEVPSGEVSEEPVPDEWGFAPKKSKKDKKKKRQATFEDVAAPAAGVTAVGAALLGAEMVLPKPAEERAERATADEPASREVESTLPPADPAKDVEEPSVPVTPVAVAEEEFVSGKKSKKDRTDKKNKNRESTATASDADKGEEMVAAEPPETTGTHIEAPSEEPRGVDTAETDEVVFVAQDEPSVVKEVNPLLVRKKSTKDKKTRKRETALADLDAGEEEDAVVAQPVATTEANNDIPAEEAPDVDTMDADDRAVVAQDELALVEEVNPSLEKTKSKKDRKKQRESGWDKPDAVGTEQADTAGANIEASVERTRQLDTEDIVLGAKDEPTVIAEVNPLLERKKSKKDKKKKRGSTWDDTDAGDGRDNAVVEPIESTDANIDALVEEPREIEPEDVALVANNEPVVAEQTPPITERKKSKKDKKKTRESVWDDTEAGEGRDDVVVAPVETAHAPMEAPVEEPRDIDTVDDVVFIAKDEPAVVAEVKPSSLEKKKSKKDKKKKKTLIAWTDDNEDSGSTPGLSTPANEQEPEPGPGLGPEPVVVVEDPSIAREAEPMEDVSETPAPLVHEAQVEPPVVSESTGDRAVVVQEETEAPHAAFHRDDHQLQRFTPYPDSVRQQIDDELQRHADAGRVLSIPEFFGGHMGISGPHTGRHASEELPVIDETRDMAVSESLPAEPPHAGFLRDDHVMQRFTPYHASVRRQIDDELGRHADAGNVLAIPDSFGGHMGISGVSTGRHHSEEPLMESDDRRAEEWHRSESMMERQVEEGVPEPPTTLDEQPPGQVHLPEPITEAHVKDAVLEPLTGEADEHVGQSGELERGAERPEQEVPEPRAKEARRDDPAREAIRLVEEESQHRDVGVTDPSESGRQSPVSDDDRRRARRVKRKTSPVFMGEEPDDLPGPRSLTPPADHDAMMDTALGVAAGLGLTGATASALAATSHGHAETTRDLTMEQHQASHADATATALEQHRQQHESALPSVVKEAPAWSFANIGAANEANPPPPPNRDSGVVFADSPVVSRGHESTNRDSGYVPSPASQWQEVSHGDLMETGARPPRPLTPTSSNEDLRATRRRDMPPHAQAETAGHHRTTIDREPSPVKSTSKDRSSVLFHSSPSYHAEHHHSPMQIDTHHLSGPTTDIHRSPSIHGHHRSREELRARGERHGRSPDARGHSPLRAREPAHEHDHELGHHAPSTPRSWPAHETTDRSFSPPKTPLHPIPESEANTRSSHRQRELAEQETPDRSHQPMHHEQSSHNLRGAAAVAGLAGAGLASAAVAATAAHPASSSRDHPNSRDRPDSRAESLRDLPASHVPSLGTVTLRTPSQRQPRHDSVDAVSAPSASTRELVAGHEGSRDMADVYDGHGEFQGSAMSPTRPPSMRKRQSMQQIRDLESRLDQLASENRLLAEAKIAAEKHLEDLTYEHTKSGYAADEALQVATAQLREKDEVIAQLRASLEQMQHEVHRLTEAHVLALAATHQDHGDRYAQLEQQHAQLEQEHAQLVEQREGTTRELVTLRRQHQELSSGMEDIVRHEIDVAMAEKNAEIDRLHGDLELAREKIHELQQQILSTPQDDVLTVRDEDYFDNACQQLCQHVQQWVLRFSKFSDDRVCRTTNAVRDEKVVDRFDNAILDGSDVDVYLADRVRRRDVFMSVVMTMIWEYIFTRYLFGMDREQRQKLKQLEKNLAEVGSPSAVHHWRAMTLTLLSKRDLFHSQKESDTEAVALEVFDTLSKFLPPPSQWETTIRDSLRNVIRAAVDLSVEMRTQRAEYIMLPPLQPEYDTNGDLARQVYFNAALMNERSGATTSNDELEGQHAVVRMVLFPLVVKKGSDLGEGDEEIVVCPAQVLVARPAPDKRASRVVSADSRMSMHVDQPAALKSAHSIAPSTLDMSNVV